jgi:hypothetical protein
MDNEKGSRAIKPMRDGSSDWSVDTHEKRKTGPKPKSRPHTLYLFTNGGRLLTSFRSDNILSVCGIISKNPGCYFFPEEMMTPAEREQAGV